MKRFESLNGVTPLNRDQQKNIFGGTLQYFDTPPPEGGGNCPQSTCSTSADCRDNPNDNQTCREYHCGGTFFYKKCASW